MNAHTLKQIWYEIGMSNWWISRAYDPAFTMNMMHEKKTVEELYEHFQHGNWSCGDAPYYKDICFINQASEGGSEYLVIRKGIDFESISADNFTLEELKQFIHQVERATDDQLKNLEYSKN